MDLLQIAACNSSRSRRLVTSFSFDLIIVGISRQRSFLVRTSDGKFVDSG